MPDWLPQYRNLSPASKLPFLLSVSYAACRSDLGWLVSPHELRRKDTRWTLTGNRESSGMPLMCKLCLQCNCFPREPFPKANPLDYCLLQSPTPGPLLFPSEAPLGLLDLAAIQWSWWKNAMCVDLVLLSIKTRSGPAGKRLSASVLYSFCTLLRTRTDLTSKPILQDD